MGVIGKLIKGAVDTALLPVDIVKDFATLGGSITEEDEPYTIQKVKQLIENAQDIYDGLDD